jgi:cytochrome P450
MLLLSRRSSKAPQIVHPPSGPRRPFWSGNAADFAGDILGFYRTCDQISDEGTVRLHLWRHPIYVVTNPDRIEEVMLKKHDCFIKSVFLKGSARAFGGGLLTSDGDFWLRQRRAIQPLFHPSKMPVYVDIIKAQGRKLAARFRDCETRDVYTDVVSLCLDGMTQSIFGEEVRDGGELVTDLARTLQEFHIGGTAWLENPVGGLFFSAFFAVATKLGRPDWNFDWSRLPLGFARPFRRAVERLDAHVYAKIASARAQRGGTGLLASLIDARSEDGKGLTDKQIRDEVVTMFLAGHETTASTIALTLDFLATHPEALNRVQRELDAVLGGAEPDMDSLQKLPSLRAAVSETLRLFPPVYRVSRTVVKDTTIGPYDILAGAELIIPQWAVHRSPRHYEEPDAYRPERWTPEFTRSLHRFAYLPFGAGPRTCIGNNFAVLEATLIVAILTQAFHFRRPLGTTVEPYDGFSLMPRNGRLDLIVERRNVNTARSSARTAFAGQLPTV